MRLININTLALEEYFSDIPPYAILSHTWGEDEASFQDWQNIKKARKKKGFWKIKQTCEQAKEDGYEYAWVDTVCIDKTSSSELSEAINSMYEWYSEAKVCYAYLEDVNVPDVAKGQDAQEALQNSDTLRAFKRSRWFTRGWTLQELLAPLTVIFYSEKWKLITEKAEVAGIIRKITGIDSSVIKIASNIRYRSVSCRMSWLANRETTRIEDMAYCMLGIFDLHMPLLYGEGHNAFLRLQQEIIRVSNDSTIFCWEDTRRLYQKDFDDAFSPTASNGKYSTSRRFQLYGWTSILAPDPVVFVDGARYCQRGSRTGLRADNDYSPQYEPYDITNTGLRISLPLLNTGNGVWALLDVAILPPGVHRAVHSPRSSKRVLLPLRQYRGHYQRRAPGLITGRVPTHLFPKSRQLIYLDCRASGSSEVPNPAWKVQVEFPQRLLLAFDHRPDRTCAIFNHLNFTSASGCLMAYPENLHENAGGIYVASAKGQLTVLLIGYHGELLRRHDTGSDDWSSRSDIEKRDSDRDPAPAPDPRTLWHVGTDPELCPPWMHEGLFRTEKGLYPSDIGKWPPSLRLDDFTTWVSFEDDYIFHVGLTSPSDSAEKIVTWSNDEMKPIGEYRSEDLAKIRRQLYDVFAYLGGEYSDMAESEPWCNLYRVGQEEPQKHGTERRKKLLSV